MKVTKLSVSIHFSAEYFFIEISMFLSLDQRRYFLLLKILFIFRLHPGGCGGTVGIRAVPDYGGMHVWIRLGELSPH